MHHCVTLHCACVTQQVERESLAIAEQQRAAAGEALAHARSAFDRVLAQSRQALTSARTPYTIKAVEAAHTAALQTATAGLRREVGAATDGLQASTQTLYHTMMYSVTHTYDSLVRCSLGTYLIPSIV
jgi:hypothetical protein